MPSGDDPVKRRHLSSSERTFPRLIEESRLTPSRAGPPWYWAQSAVALGAAKTTAATAIETACSNGRRRRDAGGRDITRRVSDEIGGV
jgi:hypothetical protein